MTASVHRIASTQINLAADRVEARILLGIHFRFADTVARRQGKQAADFTFAHILEPIQ